MSPCTGSGKTLAAIRRATELDGKNPAYAQAVQHLEPLAAVEARLDRVLGGEALPANVAMQLALARMCRNDKERYAAAVRFFAAAFATAPEWGRTRRCPTG